MQVLKVRAEMVLFLNTEVHGGFHGGVPKAGYANTEEDICESSADWMVNNFKILKIFGVE
jgi:hypothetical protein